MDATSSPDTPWDVYKAILDELVAETSQSLCARLLTEKGTYPGIPEYSIAFVQSMSPDQRVAIAAMLSQERVAAIHDVLAAFTWWLDCKEVRVTYQGLPMPVGVEGGPHNDFIGRLYGCPWPPSAK